MNSLVKFLVWEGFPGLRKRIRQAFGVMPSGFKIVTSTFPQHLEAATEVERLRPITVIEPIDRPSLTATAGAVIKD